MSENVEDLYLKGFLAFSSKNFDSARAYWKKVLEIEPGHQKAREGLGKLSGQSPKQQSSKEILAEIKRCYGDQKYREAFKLCEMLLRRHPNNKDLIGLRRKIHNRMVQVGGAQAEAKPSAKKKNDYESTMYFTRKAEEFVDDIEGQEDGAGGSGNARVEVLIQAGVTNYEVQDYEGALSVWRKALELDPDNRIVRDYIQNVQNLLGDSEAEDEASNAAAQADPTPAAPPTAPPDAGGRPTKQQLLEAYNQGLKLYQDQRLEEAMGKWSYILQYHPRHKETLLCLEKTKTALEKQRALGQQLAEAKQALQAGDHGKAESILRELKVTAPNLAGLDQLEEAVESRKRQITEIRSLELEHDAETPEETFDAAPSEEELTKFFTPEASGKPIRERQVAKVIQTNRRGRSISFGKIAIGFGLVAILAGGGYFGYQKYQTFQASREMQAVQAGSQPVIEPEWNSEFKAIEDFQTLARDFEEQDPMLSILAYRRVLAMTEDRLAAIGSMSKVELVREIEKEEEDLREVVAEGEKRLPTIQASFELPEIDEKTLEIAESDFRRGRYLLAIENYRKVLANDMDSLEIRNKLGEARERAGLEEVAKTDLNEALVHFRRAAILKTNYQMPRRHFEVIQRFYRGAIQMAEKDQWFFFFTD